MTTVLSIALAVSAVFQAATVIDAVRTYRQHKDKTADPEILTADRSIVGITSFTFLTLVASLIYVVTQ